MPEDIKKEEVKEEAKEILKKEEPVKKPKKAKRKEPKTVIRTKPLPKIKLISFDVFFNLTRSKNRKIKAHHKKPMEIFFRNECGLLATREVFDKVLKKY